MKTIVMMLMVLITSGIAGIAQHPAPEEIPDKVKGSLSADFPDALNPQWMLSKNEFKVFFDDKGILRSVKYDKKGRLVEMQEAYELENLPKEVSATLSSKYSGYTPYEAEKVELANTEVLYNVDIENEFEFIELRLSADGKVLGKVKRESRSDWGAGQY